MDGSDSQSFASHIVKAKLGSTMTTEIANQERDSLLI